MWILGWRGKPRWPELSTESCICRDTGTTGHTLTPWGKAVVWSLGLLAGGAVYYVAFLR